MWEITVRSTFMCIWIVQLLELTEGPKVITCEGKSSKLSCSSPSYIEVTSATWGQSSDKTCFWDWRNCVTLDVLSKAKRQCDSKHFCKVTANTATYGSTCYGIVKALAISYSCTVPTCGTPKLVKNGYINPGNNNVGTTRYYYCNEGYTGTGSNKIFCQSNRRWTNSGFKCKIVDCGAAPIISNSSVSTTATTYKAIVYYSCDMGYYPTGSPNYTMCQSDATWSISSFTCLNKKKTTESPTTAAYAERPANASSQSTTIVAATVPIIIIVLLVLVGICIVIQRRKHIQRNSSQAALEDTRKTATENPAYAMGKDIDSPNNNMKKLAEDDEHVYAELADVNIKGTDGEEHQYEMTVETNEYLELERDTKE